ncbi:uncharacterized protein [Physcomitrium patens]|uniref:uncharacterized protein isoform X4 n=1 Tax=Physcomitrium patens TaxID=3218 RepID=UPI003CCD7D24
MERKFRIRKTGGKVPIASWRRRTPCYTPPKKVLSMSSDNVDLRSPPDAMMCSRCGDDPLLVMASSTGYSTDAFDRDEERFIKDLQKPKTPRKNMINNTSEQENLSAGTRGDTFVFQKRHARIDWRTLHTIDVNRVIREVDIDTLEMVLDTIAFSDIRGEDVRNFTEANFVKIFRLAQLMVEYLLHVQELLAEHKSELLRAGANMQQKHEKIRQRFLWQKHVLLKTRNELKKVKKSLKMSEIMLEVQRKSQDSKLSQPQVRHCPLCEKIFESSHYLDMHVARRHPKPQEVTEEKILAMISKAEEMKAETNLAVHTEILELRERYQADLQKAATTSNLQVQSLQAELRESNNQLHEVQTRLEVLQAQILSPPHNARLGNHYSVTKSKDKDNIPDQEKIYDSEGKFMGLEHQLETLGQENSRLLEELNVAYAKISAIQSTKQQSDYTLKTQLENLREENQYLKRTMSKVNNVAIEKEPIAPPLKERRSAPSPRVHWTREPKCQALIALARPTAWRQVKTARANHDEDSKEQKSPPEHEPYRHSTSPVQRTPRFSTQKIKYETSPERERKPLIFKPKTTIAVARGEPAGDEISKAVQEMDAPHKQKRSQKVVKQLVAKELLERVEKKKKERNCNERARRYKRAIQYSSPHKSETPSESDNEVEEHTTIDEEEKVKRIQEISEVAAIEVGEDKPTIPIPEKQKWLSEHPYIPIPTLPYAVAKYPHPETAFEKVHEEIANEFDGQLREELKKFGIPSNTNGISDTTYNSISSALDKQRSMRMSQIHGDERKVMEYERGAILWHMQRAVHDRDMEIIESQFDVTTASGSDHFSDTNASDESEGESGKSNYNSSRSHQSQKSDESDSELNKKDNGLAERMSGATSLMRSSEQCSVQSSNIGDSPRSSDVPETTFPYKNQAVDRVKKSILSKVCGPGSPSYGLTKDISRAFSWKQNQVNITYNKQESLTQAQHKRSTSETTDTARQSEVGEEVEEAPGLGDWESDEDAVPVSVKHTRVKIDDHKVVSASRDSFVRDLSPPKEILDLHQSKSTMASYSYKSTLPQTSPKSFTANSSENNGQENAEEEAENNESDESDEGSELEENKIFKELTSEIDEIISL